MNTQEDYRIELDVYSGPLDLLLYLIKRDEIEITDIPVAHVAEQYVAYLKQLDVLDINVAGEFLVMAATLLEIKAAMISPREEQAEDDDAMSAAEDPTDPRYELIQQLLAYKRFKDAAADLESRHEDFAKRFAHAGTPATAESADKPDTLPQLELEDVQLWDLVEAFTRVMEQVGTGPVTHDVVADDTPIELHASDIEDRLKREGPMTLRQIFEGRRRGEMIGLFLAILELARRYTITFSQTEQGGEIHLALRDPQEQQQLLDAEAQQDSQRDPADVNNPDDFDWPDDATRQRYARRLQRRAAGEKIEEDEQLAADLAAMEQDDDADAEPTHEDEDVSDDET